MQAGTLIIRRSHVFQAAEATTRHADDCCRLSAGGSVRRPKQPNRAEQN